MVIDKPLDIFHDFCIAMTGNASHSLHIIISFEDCCRLRMQHERNRQETLDDILVSIRSPMEAAVDK